MKIPSSWNEIFTARSTNRRECRARMRIPLRRLPKTTTLLANHPQVFYPKWENREPLRRAPFTRGWFRRSFPLVFASQAAAEVLYDALTGARVPVSVPTLHLRVHIPSLRTMLSLTGQRCMTYPGRLSVLVFGVENACWLLKIFVNAWKAAEDVHRTGTNTKE